MAFNLPGESAFPAAAFNWATHLGAIAIPQILVLAGSLAAMLAWIWLFGYFISGTARGARAYFRAWWRVVKWSALAGCVLGLMLLQLIPAPLT
jgi:hypothetical protein